MTSKLAIHGGPKIRSRPFTAWPIYDLEEEKRLLQVLHSGKWGKLDGLEVKEFERGFAALHGAKHGIAVVNGTVSLQIALLAAGIRAEDEVIVPPYTFLSTASAVIEVNAVPVFVDLDLETCNIDPKAIEAAITPRTRAIIPVHFAGQPVDLDVILSLAARHNLVVIEDAAHAHGALYRGRPVGAVGHLGSFSFQSSKNLTSGEGGIITTNDDALAAACDCIHNCGRRPGGLWYEHHVMSGNYRLGEFQGAILNCQLARLEAQTQTRDGNGTYLAAKLREIPGVYPQRRTPECTRHSYHLFWLRIDPAEFGAPRLAVLEALNAEGIPVARGYAWPLYQQPLFRNKAFGPYMPQAAATIDFRKVHCPNCERICSDQGAWLEQSLFLGPREDMDDIVRAFAKVYENRQALNEARA